MYPGVQVAGRSASTCSRTVVLRDLRLRDCLGLSPGAVGVRGGMMSNAMMKERNGMQRERRQSINTVVSGVVYISNNGAPAQSLAVVKVVQ